MPKIQDIYSLQIRTLDDVMTLALQSKVRIATIYGLILAETEAQPELSELTSTSKTALWRVYCFLTAFQLWLHEFLWVKYKVFLDEAATYAQPHTAAWYRQKALEYQHGDTLQVINGSVYYDPIDEENRIIAAVAVKETTSGILIIKVAKLEDEALVGLEEAELSGFEGYVAEYKDAGVRTQIVSQNADVLKLEADIHYNPGISAIDTFQPALEASIVQYIQNLDFDGKVRIIKLIDAMQSVAGFVDIEITNAEASVAYTVTPNFVSFDREYETVSGYLNIDENFPLSVTLNYIASV
jgi:hypothetical protein